MTAVDDRCPWCGLDWDDTSGGSPTPLELGGREVGLVHYLRAGGHILCEGPPRRPFLGVTMWVPFGEPPSGYVVFAAAAQAYSLLEARAERLGFLLETDRHTGLSISTEVLDYPTSLRSPRFGQRGAVTVVRRIVGRCQPKPALSEVCS